MITENASINSLRAKSIAILNSYGLYSKGLEADEISPSFSSEKTLGQALEENGLDQHLVLRDLNRQKKKYR